ncbi:MAG: two-component system response regulator [Rhodospirillales bacterium 12-54-5]|nr:MAG: two-component system response regulator [Rhodospirillales bacterium 12-54-5]
MKTCLIVDDSKIVRKVVRRIIEGLKFNVLEAENGQEAVDLVKANAVDVIILDWNMPVMDGLECMQVIRADATLAAQPIIIFCTTENEFSKIQTAIMAGANEYVMKPFDEEIIAGKLRQFDLLSEG